MNLAILSDLVYRSGLVANLALLCFIHCIVPFSMHFFLKLP
jgi:hypothetical protein